MIDLLVQACGHTEKFSTILWLLIIRNVGYSISILHLSLPFLVDKFSSVFQRWIALFKKHIMLLELPSDTLSQQNDDLGLTVKISTQIYSYFDSSVIIQCNAGLKGNFVVVSLH